MQAQAICLLASQVAKGGRGMVGIAGQWLNLVLEDLKLNRNLKVNRVTATLNLTAGVNGPYNLPSDYLRTYDMFYPLVTPGGNIQFLNPVTMEQYDAEIKFPQPQNYPYEFATDLSTQALAASTTQIPGGQVNSININTPGFGYTSAPTVSFTGGGGSGAAAVARLGMFNGGILAAGGTGYVVDDFCTLTGGIFNRPMTLIVLSVGGSGNVINYQVIDAGDYSALPGASSPTTGGTGTGLQITPATASVSSVTLTSGGNNYTSAPGVLLSGGGFIRIAFCTCTISSSTSVAGAGQVYVYPAMQLAQAVTHRYMRNQPDLVTPETSTATPWFPYTDYLVKATAAHLMGTTGDDRATAWTKEAEEMLRPHLIMEGDEQQTVHAIRLDPRIFRSPRAVRPTKTMPY